MKKRVKKTKRINVVEKKNKFLRNFIIIGVVVLVVLFVFAIFSGKKEADREDELASIWDIGILLSPISGSSGDVSSEVDVDLGGVSKLQVEDECYCMPEGEESSPSPLVESNPMLNFLVFVRDILENNMVQATDVSCGVGFVKVCTPGGKTKGKIRKDYIIKYTPSDPIELTPTAPTLRGKVERFCFGTIGGSPVPIGPSNSEAPAVTHMSLYGTVFYKVIYTIFEEYPFGIMKYLLVDGFVDDEDTPTKDYTWHPPIYPAAPSTGTGQLVGNIKIYLYSVPFGIDDRDWLKLKNLQDAYKRHEEVHVQVFQQFFNEVEMLINSPLTTSGTTHPELSDGIHVPEGPYNADTDPITPHVKADLDKGIKAALDRAYDSHKAFDKCVELKWGDSNWIQNNVMGSPGEVIDIPGESGVLCWSAELVDALTNACKGEAGV